MLRHSTAHVLAEAVTRLFPGAKYAIGPAIADGFYYDFELPDGQTFSDDDLAPHRSRDARDREGRTSASSARSSPTTTRSQLFADQPYKREIIEKVRAGEADDEDAGEAGGDGGRVGVPQRRERRRRASSTCAAARTCPSTEQARRVQAHEGRGRVLARQREGPDAPAHLRHRVGVEGSARRAPAPARGSRARDHRKLGVELDLFSFPEEIGSGLAVFHPKGALVRRIMEEYSRQRHEASGYEFVNSPHITKAGLFETSGHLDWFADGMFPPMHLDEGGQAARASPTTSSR